MASTQLKILVSLFLKQNSKKLLTDLFGGFQHKSLYKNVTFGDLTFVEGEFDDITILYNSAFIFSCGSSNIMGCYVTFETINILDYISFEDIV